MAADSPSDDAEDEALVAAMAAGDRSALATLYERHSSLLLGLALRIVREKREAEDLLHDVFLEAWRSAKAFDPKRGRVRTWLAIRMRSRALDLQKSARVSRNTGDGGLDLLVDEAEGTSPDHGRIRTALAELGQDQRRVLELAYFEGLSCTEIAERVAIPVGTVKSRIAAGLDRLRSGLVVDPTGEDPRPAGKAVGVPTPRDPASPIVIAARRTEKA
jgi:RNA polymerase sigma-70 factor (ECF subfamily)